MVWISNVNDRWLVCRRLSLSLTHTSSSSEIVRCSWMMMLIVEWWQVLFAVRSPSRTLKNLRIFYLTFIGLLILDRLHHLHLTELKWWYSLRRIIIQTLWLKHYLFFKSILLQVLHKLIIDLNYFIDELFCLCSYPLRIFMSFLQCDKLFLNFTNLILKT